MFDNQEPPLIPLPKQWKHLVKSAVLHVISLARFCLVEVRADAVRDVNHHPKYKAEIERLKQDRVLLREQMRIKDQRMQRIEPHKRPHYPPPERMRILMLRAMRHWNQTQTAERFLLHEHTIAGWLRRLDEDGEDALVRLPTPVNKFSDVVTRCAQCVRAVAPHFGRKRIAQILARAGYHICESTVARKLRRQCPPDG